MQRQATLFKKKYVSTFFFSAEYEIPSEESDKNTAVLRKEFNIQAHTEALGNITEKLLSHKNICIEEDEEKILSTVYQEHVKDYLFSKETFAISSGDSYVKSEIPAIETISMPYYKNMTLLRTKESLMNQTELGIIQEEINQYFSSATSNKKSRFTYQQVTNSEVHVNQLNQTVISIVNRLLNAKLYPTIHQYYSDFLAQHENLFVYDALIIRYNATIQNASQPLHRDLGIISVNIALNEGFEGGGTLFESLQYNQTMKPVGTGCGILHPSSLRHSAAATTSGIRDILVIFITQRLPPLHVLFQGKDYLYELNARLKSAASLISSRENYWKKVIYYKKAIETVPTDGEAWQFFAMAIINYLDTCPAAASSQFVRQKVIQYLEVAKFLTPFDERVYNNLGIHYQSYLNNETKSEIIKCFEYSIEMQEKMKFYSQVNFFRNYALTLLNLALFYSKLDMFREAVASLELINSARNQGEESADEVLEVLENSKKLLLFCQKKLT